MRIICLLLLAGVACVGVEFESSGAGGSSSGMTSTGGGASGGNGAGATGAAGGGTGASVTGAGGTGGAECDLGSPDHCGECNHSCAGGACIGGTCEPLPMLAEAIGEARGLVIAEGSVVWLVEGNGMVRGVYSIPVDGSPGLVQPVQVAKGTSGERIAYHTPDLFFTYDVIYRVPLDSMAATPVTIPGLRCRDHLAFDANGRLYCRVVDLLPADLGAPERVGRMLDPGGATPMVDSSWTSPSYSSVKGLAPEGGSLYFGTAGGLRLLPQAGGAVQNLVGTVVAGDVVQFGGSVFFGASESSGGVQRLLSLPVGGTVVDELAVVTTLPTYLHVDDDHVFFASAGSGVVLRFDRATELIGATWNLGSDVRGLAGEGSYLFATTTDGQLHRLVK